MKPRSATGGRPGQKMYLLASGDESQVMTVPEVATYLKCHPSTVYRLLKAGYLPGVRLGGGWRFLRSEVDKWVADRRVPAIRATKARWPGSR
jgi:excisionase family DNA binding protein